MRVAQKKDGYQSCNTTWRPADDRPFVILNKNDEPLRDSAGRVRRWGTRAAAEKALARTDSLQQLSDAAKKAMPATDQEARNVIADVADVVKRLRTLHASSAADLTLPEGVPENLRVAQEALFAALRKLEAGLA